MLNRLMTWLAKVLKWDVTPKDFTELPYLPDTSTDGGNILVPKPENSPVAETLLWNTPQHAFHSTRVVCDEIGLSYPQKNILCACVFQESRFSNKAVGKNAHSTDWGIVQINDHFNIGVGKPFPSVEYVLEHPEECVRWMARIYKNTGALQPWSSFTSGAYTQWLVPTSPMWGLKVV